MFSGMPPIAARAGCPCRKSNPDILMVQSAENWCRENAPNGLNSSLDRKIVHNNEWDENLWLVRCDSNQLDRPATSALLDDLRTVGNAALHPDDDTTFTKGDALRYRALADRVIARLELLSSPADFNLGESS